MSLGYGSCNLNDLLKTQISTFAIYINVIPALIQIIDVNSNYSAAHLIQTPGGVGGGLPNLF